MKYLKPIRNINEKQLSFFKDYKPHDHPVDLASHFISKYKVETKAEKTNFIQSWDEALDFFNGETHKEKYVKALIERLEDEMTEGDYFNDLYWDFGRFEGLFKIIYEYLNDINVKIDDDSISEFLDNAPNYEEFEDWIEEYFMDGQYSWDDVDFIKWAVRNDYYFQIFDDRYHTFSEILLWLRDGDGMIYRVITLPGNKEDIKDTRSGFEFEGVGIYWSYHKSAAEAHWGDHNQTNTILMTAKVEPNDIDWEKTLTASVYRLNDEKEINLYESISLEMVSVEIDNRLYNNLLDKDHDYYRNILGLTEYDVSIIKNQKRKKLRIDYDGEDPVYVKVGKHFENV